MEKEYEFLAVAKEIARGYVTAKSKKEAEEKILNDDYDDVIDTYDMELIEIIDIQEGAE